MVPFMMVMLSAVLYLCAAALSAYQIRQREAQPSSLFNLLYFIALVLHSAAIGMGSVSNSGTLIQGPNILMLASWSLAIIFTIFEIVNKRPYSFVSVVAPIITFMMLAASFMELLTGGTPTYNAVYEQWPVLVIHVVMFFVAISCFIIAAVSAAILIYQSGLAHKDSGRFFNLKLPALDSLRKVIRRSVLLGLPFFTAGIFVGLGRLMGLWGVSMDAGLTPALLNFTIRIVFSVIIWLVFAAIAVMAYLAPGKVSMRKLAWITIIGGILSVILLVISSVEMV